MTHIYFSYDGESFRSHADSNVNHYGSSLANVDGQPLAVGGYSPETNAAETFDYTRNTWTEIAAYPYHDM